MHAVAKLLLGWPVVNIRCALKSCRPIVITHWLSVSLESAWIRSPVSLHLQSQCDSGGGVLGEGAAATSHGVWGSALSSPRGVRGGAPTANAF